MNPNCMVQIRLYISNCKHDKFTWIFKGNLKFNLSKIELQLSLPKAGLSTSFPVLKNGNSNTSSSSGNICTATPHIQNLSVLPPRWNKIPTTHSMMVQLVLNEQELGHWPVLLKFSPSLVFRGGGRIDWRWGQTTWRNSKHLYPGKQGGRVCFHLLSSLGIGLTKWVSVTCWFLEPL